MRNLMLAAFLAACCPVLWAAGGVIQLKDGKSNKAYDIQAETISGVFWESEKDKPGARINLWDLEGVQYNGQAMDAYNSLARKLAGGRGAPLAKDAKAVIAMDTAPSGFDAAQWGRVQLSAKYYAAMADYLDMSWASAISGLESYIIACEATDKVYDKGVAANLKYTSKISGKAVANAGGLNRFYLDALEKLGLAYIKSGDAKSANEKAFMSLQLLTEEMAKSNKRYLEWAMRALKASAKASEEAKDYKGARESYSTLLNIAVTSGGEKSRPVYEAKLKIGYMMILEGDTRGANAKFSEAIKEWEKAHDAQKKEAPRKDWINADEAYLVAGSYLGEGLVTSAGAKKAEDWAEAHASFSMSLAIFNADDEIRSKALLGAANASAKLAELNKDSLAEVKDERGNMVKKAVASNNYAVLAEKYLSELTSLFGKTPAAEDPKVQEIQKTINKYKDD